MPGPYRAAAGKPPAVRKRAAEGSRPLPTDRPINECLYPTARRCGNGDKTEAIPFPGLRRFLYKHISA